MSVESFRFLSGVDAGTIMYLARPFLGLEAWKLPPTLVTNPAALALGVTSSLDYCCTLLKNCYGCGSRCLDGLAGTPIAFQPGG